MTATHTTWRQAWLTLNCRISSGLSHSLALKKDGTVIAWDVLWEIIMGK